MKTFEPPRTFSRSSFLRTLALGLPLLQVASSRAQTPGTNAAAPAVDMGNLRAFVELARSDIKTDKALIFAQNLDLSSDEAVEFWPLERDYQAELQKLLDQRYDLLVTFVKNYGSLTDQQASELATKSFDLEAQRTDLKRKYFKKLCKVLPAVKAARFFQLENQVNAAVDLQVAASLPLIK